MTDGAQSAEDRAMELMERICLMLDEEEDTSAVMASLSIAVAITARLRGVPIEKFIDVLRTSTTRAEAKAKARKRRREPPS